MEWNKMKTEMRNENTEKIDTLPTIEMMRLINEEDKKVALAVEKELAKIAAAVDLIAAQLKEGGRLIYVGCGTSGRLGVLDAAECPPTYSTEPDQVMGIMAGGPSAMFRAAEGAEDNQEAGADDLKKINLCNKDVVVGLAASGRTPYVLGAMAYAKLVGAHVLSITCCPGSPVEAAADIAIVPAPGPEAVTGSTRMKSGTAQKMVLNMLSTGAMIKLGKVYGNLMVDVKPSNEKLLYRCQRIVCEATGADEAAAIAALEACGHHPKAAIVMLLKHVDAEQAVALLAQHDGRIADVLNL